MSTPLDNTLSLLTDFELDRLYRRVWKRMTRGNGYQPFGYDSVTLWATHPEWMTIIEALRAEARRRKNDRATDRSYAG